MSEEKTPTVEEPKVEVKETADLNELVKKAVADASALVTQEKEEKRADDSIMQEAVNRAVADIMAKQKDAQEEKAQTEAKKVDATAKPERKGLFTENKSGGLALGHKAMLDRPAWDEKSQRVQDLNDDVFLMSILLKKSPSEFASVEGMAMAQELKSLAGTEQKTAGDPLYSTLAASGDEWVPTGWSNQIFKTIEHFGTVEQVFPHIKMPRNPYKLPVQIGRGKAYIHTEQTSASPSKYTDFSYETDDVTLTAVLIAARTVFTDVYDEDGIVAQLPWIKQDIARALVYGVENAIINGDDNGTHMDTGDADASPEMTCAWDGLRFYAKTVEDTGGADTFFDGAAASLSSTLMNVVRTRMGKYAAKPSDLAWFLGPKSWIQLMRDSNVLTMEKYGPKATILNGELGQHGGIPIIVTELQREDLDSDGLYTGSNKNHSCPLLANRTQFVVGTRREVKVDSQSIFGTDSSEVIATRRVIFEPMEDGINDADHGKTPVGGVYEIDVTTSA